MLGLRIGGVNKADRPADDGPASPLWCSQRDVAQMVERCIEATKDLHVFDACHYAGALLGREATSTTSV